MMDMEKWIDLEKCLKPGYIKTKKVRLCVECSREKPYYRPTATPGYGPHCYDRDNWCEYCLKETDTITKTLSVEATPSPSMETNRTDNDDKTKHRRKSKYAKNDKCAVEFNTHTSELENEMHRKGKKAAKTKKECNIVISGSWRDYTF
jgi:hypothetical protein